jgi:hypothetical protein
MDVLSTLGSRRARTDQSDHRKLHINNWDIVPGSKRIPYAPGSVHERRSCRENERYSDSREQKTCQSALFILTRLRESTSGRWFGSHFGSPGALLSCIPIQPVPLWICPCVGRTGHLCFGSRGYDQTRWKRGRRGRSGTHCLLPHSTS